jgi:hypothetical protein
MGGCRWRLWSILTILALLWMCGGPILTVAQYLSHTPKIDSSASVFYAVLNFLWIGLPVTGICAFFGYRNSLYWRKQRRYRELQVARRSKSEMQGWRANARMRQTAQRPTADSAAPSRVLATKFETAQVLIEERNYAVARAILKTIDHPKAAEWLEQIEQFGS